MRAIRVTAVRAAADEAAEQLTQLLVGERAEVHDRDGDWIRVTAPGQWTSRDAMGYPGWVRAADLAHDEESVLAIARTRIGTPYVVGGVTDAGYDGPGLVHACFRAVGVDVPRDADDQAAGSQPVGLGEERPGDLWFFAQGGPGTPVTHVGLVVAPGVVLHASRDAGAVVEEPLGDGAAVTPVSAGRF